jgi:alkylation response protein AidB-like acyl-CoA dehydrogenase
MPLTDAETTLIAQAATLARESITPQAARWERERRIGHEALRVVRAYGQQRQAFGRPLAGHQGWRWRSAERQLPVLAQAMGAEGLREHHPFARHLMGARVAGFVDGSTEMLLERICAVMRD